MTSKAFRIKPCPTCSGSTRVLGEPCSRCFGAGRYVFDGPTPRRVALLQHRLARENRQFRGGWTTGAAGLGLGSPH